MEQFDMGKASRSNLLLILLLSSFFILITAINVPSVKAAVGETCALTPEQVEGQGFRVSSLGFRVSSLGFRVSSLGFRVSSLGFRVSSLEEEAIIEEIVNNQVTPAWLVDALPYVTDGVGYNSQSTYILVVDDFSASDSHGVKVKGTVEKLIAAVAADEEITPNIIVREVDISGVTSDAALIAVEIKNAVEGIRVEVGESPVNIVVNMSFGLVPCEEPGGVELIDEESGKKFTVEESFSFSEVQQGAPEDRPFERLSPVLECVVVHYKDESSDHGKFGWGWGHKKRNIEGYTAYFGYNNPNLYPVTIPVGLENRFHPFPSDKGQPTEFAPGRQRAVFSVDYSYGFVKWRLGHKWAMAWLKSPVCPDNEPPQMSSQIIREGYSLTEYAQEQLGIPEEFVDEYYDHLFEQANETETDPFRNIQLLMRMYLEESAASSNFSFVPVASAGNFAYLLGTEPLKPAAYPEVVGVSATVGDFGPLWRLSHYGDIRSPGVSVPIAFEIEGDPTSPVTEIGAGTSHAAPFTTVLYGLWLTYPGACDFNPGGLPPLLDDVLANRNQNEIFTGIETPLDCSYNLAPEMAITFGGSADENTPTVVGTVSDPDGESISLSVDNERFSVFLNEDGFTWGLTASDNLPEIGPETVNVTATDSRGASTTIEVTITVNNVAPTATLLANGVPIVDEVMDITVSENDPVTLKLVDPFDQSEVDTTAGFTYSFDCGYEYEEEVGDTSDNMKVCTYPIAGEYVASATIMDKDGDPNTYDVIITVEHIDEVVGCYASFVVDGSYQPGRRRDGRKIYASRRQPHMALGAPQDDYSLNFVTLGFPSHKRDIPAGSIILGFDYSILNNNGSEPDIRIWETTFGDQKPYREWEDYPEAVKIYASVDGIHWSEEPIGVTTDIDQAYDLGEMTHANYIKLVDATKPYGFSGSADGFDLDAVEGFECGVVGS